MSPKLQPALVAILSAACVIAAGPGVSASGYVGVYGVIEKVVFEPNGRAPERLQVWGAFVYVDGGTAPDGAVSPARRGYLYFRLPPGSSYEQLAKQEWNDLKSIAGTGQAVGFGACGYWGTFDGLDPAETYRGVRLNGGLRVRPASEPPSAPIYYPINVGVVKVPAEGSRRDVVQALQQEIGKH